MTWANPCEKLFRAMPNPLYCPGAYSMHFYCKYENPDHGFEEFPWESDQCQTRGEALAWARAAGWRFHRDHTATCPKCAKRLAAGHKPASSKTEIGPEQV